MKAIVYTSGTGFTQRYAQLLSELTGVPACPLKEAKKALPRDCEIFYMGWLMAGTLQGLAQAQDRFTIRGAAIVGISPQGNGELWTEAKINGGTSDGGARLFYLQGGYAPEKLPFFRRIMMRMMEKQVVKNISAKTEKTAGDLDMLDLFQNGGDRVDPERLTEIADWFRNGPHDGILKSAPTVDI